MSRTKLLLDVVKDIRSLADSLQTLANAIAGDDVADEASDATVEPVAKPPVTVTLEQVRAVLAEKSHDGFTEQVRGLLQKYGAQKLSAIASDRYPDLLRDAKELTDAGK